MDILYIWFALALILAILEMALPSLFLFLSFSLGAFVAGISSIWIESLVAQCLFFLAGTLLALAALRQWIKAQFKAPEAVKPQVPMEIVEEPKPTIIQKPEEKKSIKERPRKEKIEKPIQEVKEEKIIPQKPKELPKKEEPSKILSNVYALKGQRGIVLKSVTPKTTGVVKIGGEVWSARTAREEVIAVGSTVEVIDVIGVHLIVERVS